MPKPLDVMMTDSFAAQLAGVRAWLLAQNRGDDFVALHTELQEKVIPYLGLYPVMGWQHLCNRVRSVEADMLANKIARTLQFLSPRAQLREYLLRDYCLLYAYTDQVVWLLSIHHQDALSRDFAAFWKNLDKQGEAPEPN